ncbi:hypothetical protein [Paenibacillus sp. FSL R7-0273]|uniref:hypothetical protein n=1 Tax=Paenibacillus sp. FSL R7-0273 TaxID=1536772 RepID=UPI0015C342A0|nr:hypothetical protein [Paenibacillus sp. FSL R7-0273]
MNARKNIYIVLSGTGTAFSGLIKWFTKAELNHASIAFDSGLQEVYSFGRKKVHNPFVAGLIRENFEHPFYSTADCAIYEMNVSQEEYDTMYNHVLGMMVNQGRYKYHLLGLIGVLLNVRFDREDAYFCSHFVASVCEEAACRPVAKPSCFVTPEDFAESLCANKIYSGKLAYYMHLTHGNTYISPPKIPAAAASLNTRRLLLAEERAEGIV